MGEGDNYAKNRIVEMMFGEWFFKKSGLEINIKINSKNLLITKIEKGKTTIDEVAAGSYWFLDKLLFTEKQKYYVKHADEFEMTFGEVNPPLLTEIVWERKFERSYPVY